jgi:(4S)-4-hydroxy-5-phosphonooxypentane-2,3-dione isomerase
MYAIFVTLDVDPRDSGSFLEASTADAVGSVNDEAGCLRFDISRDPSTPGRFYFYEVYRDRGAFAAHESAPHFVSWRAAVGALLLAEPTILELETCIPVEEDWTPQRRMGQND